MAAEQASAAIVLRARDYSESDRIVTCLTRDFGKLAGMAKGAKMSRRRFERKLEPFAHVMLYFRRRPHGQLVFLTRAEANAELAPFGVEDDLGKIALGMYMLDLADALTSDGAEAADAYRLLEEALEALSAGGASAALRQAFELRLLRWAGFGLDFSRCRWCQRPAIAGNDAAGAFFVAASGGIACARCGPAVAQAAIKLDPASLAALAGLGEMEFGQALGARAAGADGALAISRFVASILDRRLRSAGFLDSVMRGSA
jgi:DNA repair protein RecO (recombination protein O)